MKLLITSPDALLDINGNLFNGIEQVLLDYKALDAGNDVVVLSSHKHKLEAIPATLNPIRLSAEVRAKKVLIESIQKATDFKEINEIIVLGANEQDFRLAVNSKLLLFAAEYAKTYLNEYSKVFIYGVPIFSVEQLGQMLQRLFTVQQPWYFLLNVTPTTTVYSLTNANTKNQPSSVVDANNKFRSCIKNGNDTYRDVFTMYFLFSSYDDTNIVDLKQVKYWSIYPSSSNSEDPDLEYFKEVVRKSLGTRQSPSLLVRHKATKKKSQIYDPYYRINQSCQDELESLHLNPYYKDRLRGQVVCVIDDYTTYGTSCEATRMLLEKAGVAKLLFITLGKFGSEYYKQNYTLDGDIFSPNFKIAKVSTPTQIGLQAAVNRSANAVLNNALQGLI